MEFATAKKTRAHRQQTCHLEMFTIVAAMHRRRSSVNFRGRHFCPKNMYAKLTKCPNFTWFLPKKYQKAQIFMIIVRKINKIPEFYMIFARKCPNFINCPKNIFFANFRGGGMCLPCPPPSPSPTSICCNATNTIQNDSTWIRTQPVRRHDLDTFLSTCIRVFIAVTVGSARNKWPWKLTFTSQKLIVALAGKDAEHIWWKSDLNLSRNHIKRHERTNQPTNKLPWSQLIHNTSQHRYFCLLMSQTYVQNK